MVARRFTFGVARIRRSRGSGTTQQRLASIGSKMKRTGVQSRGSMPGQCFKDGEQIGEIREYTDTLLALLLRGRRPEVYAPRPESAPRVAFNVTTTLEEARKRVADLGLPLLQIESDYETEDEKA